MRFLRAPPAPAGGPGRLGCHRLLQEIPAATLSDDASDAAQLSDVYHRALELIRGDFEEHTWQAFWQTAVENQTPAEVAAALEPFAADKGLSQTLTSPPPAWADDRRRSPTVGAPW